VNLEMYGYISYQALKTGKLNYKFFCYSYIYSLEAKKLGTVINHSDVTDSDVHGDNKDPGQP
jgi:hypothetical protein